MTLVVSIPHREALIMAADSRKTTIYTRVDFHTMEPTGEMTYEFSSTSKLFVVPGVACVTMWGDLTRAEQHINAYLTSIASNTKEPSDIAGRLRYFLEHEIHAEDGTDLGFHVGGYDLQGKVQLYHVFWGVERGQHVDPDDNPPSFKMHDHSDYAALYNGRNDLADFLFNFLIMLDAEVGIQSWIARHPLPMTVKFADSLVRFMSKYDRTIGGMTNTAVILPGNNIGVIENSTGEAIPIEVVAEIIMQLQSHR